MKMIFHYVASASPHDIIDCWCTTFCSSTGVHPVSSRRRSIDAIAVSVGSKAKSRQKALTQHGRRTYFPHLEAIGKKTVITELNQQETSKER